jgi:hypothetical protein
VASIGANDTSIAVDAANATRRWRRFADNKYFDKFGVIAQDYGAHLSIKVKMSAKGVVFVGYLGSYEKVCAHARVFGRISAPYRSKYTG